ncbi:MAG: MerR family transcriptional regulator [Erysipelotrichales bacterium]|nr:MerR family transcriptional regulator [Erysipelotrichales bacterium]MBQ1385788.1 MerR family transcriptional regulator [Erysipelotrichales bacterium]MBQ2477998.1 MerR family transcriptional regulator [Erysipelotrichales bacterium]MBQ4012211.1 MerR family transcriptional regulator [Erysipelotrichales bacterium]MBQ4376049.1 MerR family transcriptional regulator [Erysipelotrichales bacterium]
MRTYFSIGEVSEITGLTINALRHYDKIGLVTPSVVNEATNYRYYSKDQLFLFEIIQFGRKLHIPLEELSEVLNSGQMSSFKDFLSQMKVRMSRQIEELHQNIQDLDSIEEEVSTGEYLSGIRDLYQRNITERDVVTAKTLPPEVNNGMIKQRANLEREIRESELVTTFDAGTIYRIINRKVEPISIYRGVVLDFDTDSDAVVHIPMGNYLCATYTEKNRAAVWQKFLAAIRDLSLNDPLIIEEELLNDIFHPEERAYELQVYLSEATPE